MRLKDDACRDPSNKTLDLDEREGLGRRLLANLDPTNRIEKGARDLDEKMMIKASRCLDQLLAWIADI